MLFGDRKRLLELYNALNDTAYANEDDLTVNTLDPNMELRGLFYFADLYKKLLGNVDLSVRRRILIPTPHYSGA